MVPPQLASPLGRQQASSLFLSKVARGLVPQPFSALPTLPCALCPVPQNGMVFRDGTFKRGLSLKEVIGMGPNQI